MNLLCLNHYVPPDAAPTARLLGELGDGLAARGWKVTLLGVPGGYRGGKPQGWRRWAADLKSHLGLLWRGLRAPRPDVVLCLTDPPGLPFTAALVAALRGAKLVHWAMDVYPEVAAALGEVSGSGIVFKGVRRLVRWSYRRCRFLVCLDEDMADALRGRNGERLLICAPWPPRSFPVPAHPAPASGPRLRWLYSGNLGRAHDYETLLRAQQLLEEAGVPCELVFQGGGGMREAAIQRAGELGLRNCTWSDYVPEEQLIDSLLGADVLVATQRPETRGLLWPSKLALLEVLPRPIVWVGPPEGGIARRLGSRNAPVGVFEPGDAAGLARWLVSHEKGFREGRQAFFSPEHLRFVLDATRKAAVDFWAGLLQDCMENDPRAAKLPELPPP